MKNFITVQTCGSMGGTSLGNQTIHIDQIVSYKRDANYNITEIDLRNGKTVTVRNSPGSIDMLIEEAQS